MNPFIRECLLGGWHMMLPEVQSGRPKEVVREKPVWVSDLCDGKAVRQNDGRCDSYQIFRAAAQETVGSVDGVSGQPIPPAAAAPIDGFRVGDVVLTTFGIAMLTKSRSEDEWPGNGWHYKYKTGDRSGNTGHNGEGSIKLLGRPGPDGWIPHKPGDPCPVPAGTNIELRHQSGWTKKYLPSSGVWPATNSVTGWRLA